MISIQYASDLHLEFPENRTFIQSNPLSKAGDILILAGDTRYLNGSETKDPFIERVSLQFEKVFLIAGNHEFYRKSADISIVLPEFEYQIRDNVTYLHNKSIIINNVRLVFSTLWSAIKERPKLIEFTMNDFDQSEFNGRRFNVDDYNYLHEQSFGFLNKELSRPFSGKTVIISHHVPVSYDVAPNPRKSEVREAYYTDMGNLMESYQVDHWIHGHNHYNMPSYAYKNTMIHNNQLGYVFAGQGKNFENNRVLKL